jgi:hypothetical protein
MPFDDPSHCDESMKLARLIPGFQTLPELLVYRRSRCGHVETVEQLDLKQSNWTGSVPH